MSIEHDAIPNADLHEPKGVSSASNEEIYFSDGAGSGVWAYPSSAKYGEMLIVGNTTGQSLTAATDSTLNTDSDYVKITGAWSAGNLDGFTFTTDELAVPVAGTYKVSFWATMQGPNGAVIGVKYAINNTTPYSLQKVKRKADSVSDVGSMSASGIVVSLDVNDKLSLYVASDTTGTVTLEDAGLIAELIHDSRV